MTKHPLPDEFLMAYSVGALPEAFSLLVASHVSISDDARVRLESYDAVGGAVLDRGKPCEMASDSLAAVLARIGGEAPAQIAPAAADPVLPAPLCDYVGGGLDDIKWRPIGMGVKQAILLSEGSVSARLLRIPSGVAVPDHTHEGLEMTLVLQGAYRDEVDEFKRGDVEVADTDLHHQPIATGDQDCICLAAADAKLKFNALLPRLAQPFLRI